MIFTTHPIFFFFLVFQEEEGTNLPKHKYEKRLKAHPHIYLENLCKATHKEWVFHSLKNIFCFYRQKKFLLHTINTTRNYIFALHQECHGRRKCLLNNDEKNLSYHQILFTLILRPSFGLLCENIRECHTYNMSIVSLEVH